MKHLAINLASFRFLMCLTRRPHPEVKLDLPADSTSVITLGELSEQQALRLVLTVLDRAELPPHVATAILSKGRGNPLFLEQIGHSLLESGKLNQLLGTTSLRLAEQMIALEIPDRLQSLIMSRIDTLSMTTKEALRTAAVIGGSFNTDALEAVFDTDKEENNLVDSLEKLVQLDFVHMEGDREGPNYRFKHALIQEVAYDSLPFARRRVLHRRIATYFEDTNIGQLEPLYEVLVHHYSGCGDNEKTLVYGVKAAGKARQVFAHDEAIAYYHRALDAVGKIGGDAIRQRSFIIERIGDCYEGGGQHAQAAKAFSSALRVWRNSLSHGLSEPVLTELAEEIPTKVRQSDLCRKIGVSYERHSDYDASLRWLESALRTLPTRQPSQASLIWVAKSLALFRKGLYDEAIRCGRLGLALSRRSSDLRQRAYAHNILATSYRAVGTLNLALRHRREALRLYEEAKDATGQAVANNNLANCYREMGYLESALHCYQASLEGFRRVGNPVRAAIVCNNIGELLLTEGRLQEAVDSLQKVVETYEKLGDPLAATGLALINLSRAYQHQRDYKRSEEHLKRGMELLHKSRNRGLLAEALLQQADLELEIGQVLSAQRKCQQVLKESRELGIKLLEVRGLRLQGQVALAEDRRRQAEVYLKESADLAEHHGWRYEKGLALLSLAELYAPRATNDSITHRRYRLFLREATSIFQHLGAQLELARIRKLAGS